MARISVILKQTGQRGTIEENEFDPTIYSTVQAEQSKKVEPTTVQPQAQNTQPVVEQPQGDNLVTSLLKGIINPAVNYTKMVGEGVFQGGRYLTDPTFRKAVSGQQLTSEESKQISDQQATAFVDPEKYKGNTTDLLLQGAKDTAGGASYLVPGGGGLVATLGKGALGGGLYGFSQSNKNLSNMDNAAGLVGDVATSAATSAAGAGLFKGIGNVLGKVFPSNKIPVSSRPEHQVMIENLLNSGDESGAQKLINALPDTDPYKASMTKLMGNIEPVVPFKNTTAGVKTYLSNFTIPTKLSKNLKPQDTANEMIKYGINGNLDDIGNKAAQVSGENGILSKLNRDVIANTPGEVNISTAIDDVQSSLSKIAELTPNEEERILTAVRKMLPAGKNVNTANPLDVFDAVKELEKLGYQYTGHSTYLTGNVKAEQIGNIYLGVADELKNSLEKSVGSSNSVQQALTPEVINQVSKVSPKLAEDLAKATTIADLRKLQAPFVRIQKMIDLTNEASSSSFQNLANQMKGASKLVPSASDPLAFLKPVLGSAKFNTKAGSVMQNISNAKTGFMNRSNPQLESTMPVIGRILGSSLANVGNQPTNINNNVPQETNTQQNNKQINDSVQNTPIVQQDNQNQNFKITPELLQQGRVELSEKGYKKLKDLYDIQVAAEDRQAKQQKAGGGNISKVSAQNFSNAKSGAESLQQVTSLLFDNNGNIKNNVILTLKTPGRPSDDARKLAAQLYNVADSFLRLRTGATANPTEIKKLASALEPGITDSPEVIKEKLSIYKNVFDEVTKLAGENGTSNVDIESLLNGLQ